MIDREMLEAMGRMMDDKLETTKADMAQMMDYKLEPIKADISEVKQRVLKIEITQENTIARQINLLTEGHIGVVDKLRGLDALIDKVEDIQNTVDVLKHIVKL